MAQRFISTPENKHDMMVLQSYFENKPDAEEFTWLRIEADTRIKMDNRGKQLVRAALRKRPYESIRGVGVRLSSAEAVPRMLLGKMRRIDGAVKRADSTQQKLQILHLEQMSARAQQGMLMMASFFGAIRSIARDADRHYKAFDKGKGTDGT